MVDLVLSLIPGGWLTAIGAGAVAMLGMVWRAYAAGKKSARNEARAEKADAYEQTLRDLEAAASAANAVRPDDGGMQHDPHNRDR